MFSDIYPSRQFDRCQWRNCKISPPARKSFGPVLLEGPLSDNTLKILCLASTVRGHQFIVIHRSVSARPHKMFCEFSVHAPDRYYTRHNQMFMSEKAANISSSQEVVPCQVVTLIHVPSKWYDWYDLCTKAQTPLLLFVVQLIQQI